MVLMHTEAREDLGACPSRNIKCSEITSEAIFGSKQPPEQVVQYSNLTFVARQVFASQAKCECCISCHLLAPNFLSHILCGICRMIANLGDASQGLNLSCKVENVAIYYSPLPAVPVLLHLRDLSHYIHMNQLCMTVSHLKSQLIIPALISMILFMSSSGRLGDHQTNIFTEMDQLSTPCNDDLGCLATMKVSASFIFSIHNLQSEIMHAFYVFLNILPHLAGGYWESNPVPLA